jgi:hypothetical protein
MNMLTVQRLYFTASMSTSDEIVKKTLTIVLCFDGTAGEYSGSVTFLSRPFKCFMRHCHSISLLLKEGEFNEQFRYYWVSKCQSHSFQVHT